MRIAQVAPLCESVPPKYYGGTERIVSGVTEELVRRGHEVVLFANGDSTTAADLIPCCPQGLRLDRRVQNHIAYTVIELGMVSDLAGEFDLIHSHIDYLGFPLSRLTQTPIITTLHGRLDLPELRDVYTEFPEVPLVSISEAQRRPLPRASWLRTIHNGIDLRHFTLRERRGSYLAFLGRISPEKCADRTIAIAHAVGIPLRIAAKIDPVDQEYFNEKIEPLLRDPLIEFVGEIDEAQQDDFLGNAFAYLFPINWPEPFGITMIEAMACGTPVVAMRHGSVPEVVADGCTGFICRSMGEMIASVGKVDRLDRRACRTHVAERFSAQRMVDSYEVAYRTVLEAPIATVNQAGGRAPAPLALVSSAR